MTARYRIFMIVRGLDPRLDREIVGTALIEPGAYSDDVAAVRELLGPDETALLAFVGGSPESPQTQVDLSPSIQ